MKISVSYSLSYRDFYRNTFEDPTEVEKVVDKMLLSRLKVVLKQKPVIYASISASLLKLYTYLLESTNSELSEYVQRNKSHIKNVLVAKLEACNKFKPLDEEDRVGITSCKNRLKLLLSGLG